MVMWLLQQLRLSALQLQRQVLSVTIRSPLQVLLILTILFTYADGTLSVTAVPLLITANDQTKAYGDANPTLTVSYTGLVNGDVAPATAPSISTTAVTSSPFGNYPITASGAADPNYTISYADGTLSVTAVPLIITANDQTKAYGDANPTLTVTYTGLVNGDIAPATAPSISTTATASSPFGTYPITATGAADPNYNITYADGTLSVTAVPLLITANDQTKAYGDANPTLTVSYTGLVNGDVAPATAPSIKHYSYSFKSFRNYPITASGASDPNYTITYADGTLSVTAVPLLITADDKTKAYGDANPTLTVTYTGLVNGDLAPATAPSISTTAITSSPSGTYPITASGAADPNYTITYADGTLSVTAVPLLITANDQTKAYGDANPTLTVSYTGLLNGDVAPATAPSISTTAITSSPFGNYPITASGASDPNYTITYADGTLSVTAVPLLITADDKTKAYGDANPTLTVTYTGLLNGDVAPATAPSISTTAITSSPFGNYPITASGASDPNYTITYADGTLSVTAVPLLITADDKTKAYGDANPTLTVTYTGLLNGDVAPATAPSISTTAVTSSPFGNYPITASGASDPNYTITYADGTLSVTAKQIEITADPQTKIFGTPDPALTYVISSGSLESGDTFTGSLTRDAGEALGSYGILQGTVALSSSYNITYIGANLIIVNDPITNATLIIDAPIACNGGTTTITATANGGDGQLQYSLNGGTYQAGNTFTVAASVDPYIVTVKDADGFTATTNSVTVIEPAKVSTPDVTVTDNCGTSTLSTTATGILFWSTGESTTSITVITGGTYTVTQTVNGCTSDAGSGIAAPKAIPSAPVLTMVNNCGNTTLSTTAAGTLLWSTGEGTSSITVITAGTYSVTQTVNGCTSEAVPFDVTVKQIPDVNALLNTTWCNNVPAAAITFSSPATGGTTTFAWTSTVNVGFGLSGSANIGAYTATNATNIPLTATVSVIATLNGCSGPATTFTVTVNPVLTAGTISGLTTVCVGSSITLSSNGNIGGTWSSANPAAATVDPASGVVTGIFAGNPTILYTFTNICGTSTASYTITVNSLPNPGTISGASAVCANSTILLSSNGTIGGTWISGTPAVAVINNPAIGFVTGVATGTSTIFYLVSSGCGTSAASFDVTVNPLPNPGTISGSSSVCAGSTIILASNGNTGGTWTSGTPAAATVNPTSGVVTGIAAGNSTIFYTVTNSCGTSSASFTITINTLPNAGTMSGATSVCVGSTIIMSSNGAIGGTWSSGTPASATVNSSTGEVTGIAAGSSIITYSVTNGCGTSTASVTIIVNPVPNAGLISGAASVCTGSTITLSSNGNPGGTWSSGTPGVATIDPATGVVTGVAAGNSTIRYNVTNSCGTTFTSITIAVNPAANAGTITGASSICAGLSTIFSSSGNPGGTWSSSIPAVATIDPLTGVVTGVSVGNSTITYSVTNSCGTTTTNTLITVNGLPTVAAIAGGAATVCVSSTTPAFTDATAGGTWSILNGTGSASISTGGVVTGVTAGTVTVRYSVTNSCGTTTVTAPCSVNALPTVAAITGGAATVCVSSTTPAFTDATAGGTWSILNGTGSASISTGGVVTGLTAGTVTVRYSVANSCGTTTVMAPCTVNALPTVAAIAGGAATVCVSSTTPAFTDATAGGTWSILNGTGSASISTGSVVTGVTAGTVTVRYSVTNSCGTTTVTKPLTVNSSPAVAAIAGGAASVCVSSTTPAFTDATAGGTWSILNGTGSASISTGGVVTGLTAGSVTVRYSVTGCGTTTVTKSLTVNALPSVAAIGGGAPTICVSSTTPAFTDATAGGTWSILNGTGTASINTSTRVVTGLTAGTVTVRYSVSNSCGTITVITSLTVNSSPTVAAIAGGATTVCLGSATPAFTDVTAGGTWSILNGTGSASISTGGVVTGVTSGSVTVRYSVTGCGTTTVTKSLTVNAGPTVAAIGGGAATVCISSTTPAFSNTTAGGTWSILNGSGTASINTLTRVVTGLTAGAVTVRYSVTGGGCTTIATKALTINGVPAVAAIGGGATTLCVGSATPAFTDATAGGTWSILNGTGSAIINAGGMATGVTAGTVTVRYSVTGCGTTIVTKALTINSVPTVAAIGGGAATVCVSLATPAFTDVTAGGTWSILNGTGSASINTLTRVVTGLTAGTVTVRYTVTSGGCSSTATRALTVNPLPNAGTVSGAASLCVGSTATFTSNGTSGGSWSSLSTSVATVNASTGVVTGVAAGTASIKYTITNSCGSSNSTKSITVSSPPTITATNISISTALNNCSASVTFGPNVTVTGIPTPGVVYQIGTMVITSPRVFPAGTTTVTVTATNSCATITRTFLVTVNDNQSPSITCKPNASRIISASQYTVSGTEFNATASDNCGTPSPDLQFKRCNGCGFFSHQYFPGREKLNVGTTTITWKATDGSDNAVTCASKVTVSRINRDDDRNVFSAIVPKLPADKQVTEPKACFIYSKSYA